MLSCLVRLVSFCRAAEVEISIAKPCISIAYFERAEVLSIVAKYLKAAQLRCVLVQYSNLDLAFLDVSIGVDMKIVKLEIEAFKDTINSAALLVNFECAQNVVFSSYWFCRTSQ